MPAHTHDGVDWAARLADLRQADAANAAALRAVADRLIKAVPAPHPTVIDVGSGAGGMSAALAAALAGRATAAIPTDTTPVAGKDPATPSQPADVAETGQSTAAPETGPPAATQPAPADTSLTANPNPATADQATGRVAETGHSTATNSKPSTDISVDDGRAAGAGSAVAHPVPESGRPADVSVDDGRVADAMSAVAHAGAVPGRPAGSAVHDSRAASTAAHPVPASRRPIDAPVHDSDPAASAQMAAHAGGATLVLVDMVPELLAAAEEAALAAVGGSGAVDVCTVRADVADRASFVGLPSADLVWASNVVHHLPDQRAAVLMLAGLLAPGGCLALSEGGLSMRCLPWDVGVGEPGLQDRLIAAHGTWFHRMRADMPDAVRLPVGWNQVLGEAGLRGVTAFSYLVDVPAPLPDDGRGAVVSWLSWMSHAAADLLDPADTAALERLLDPDDPAYVGRRDDIFMLKASTVYLGWR